MYFHFHSVIYLFINPFIQDKFFLTAYHEQDSVSAKARWMKGGLVPTHKKPSSCDNINSLRDPDLVMM